MGEGKHTPGPWKINFGHPRGLPGGISAKNGGRPVTRFNAFARPTTPEALANARLIAAAPCLLEALKAMVSDAERVGIDDGLADQADREVVKQARAAIQRATAPMQEGE